MAKKRSSHGGAPRQSARSRLQSKGYEQLIIQGQRTFSEKIAKMHAERFHDQGFLAQALHIRDPDMGNWWIVMYRRRK